MATRTGLLDVQQLRDAAQVWPFDFFIPTIPNASGTRDLTIKCQSVDMPGRSIEEVDVSLHGVTIKQAGRLTFSHQLNATFLETIDWSTRDKFLNWSEFTQSWKNNSGAVSASYKVNAAIAAYDMTPTLTRQCQVYGLWLREFGDIQLNGAESSTVNAPAGFTYDYWDDE